MYLIYMPILSPSRKFQAALVATSVVALVLVPVTSASAKSQNSQHERVVSYWTPENMASAQSLDYTFDKGSKVGRKVTSTPATKAIKPASIVATASSPTSTGASWVDGGLALAATGKVFFSVGTSRYVCSGSVVEEADVSRSVVLTAGHCLYDNATQAFVTNFLFYPDYDSNPNQDCALTTYGCWTATALIGHYGFTSQTGFTNQATNYDWGFAVMGLGGKNSTQLDATVGAFPLAVPGFAAAGGQAYAFGYPAASPYAGADLTYCSGAIVQDSGNGNSTWGLTTCTMTGGASGGPWMSGFGTDRGILSSVNSYKYTAAANGMYGPKFNANTTNTFNAALTASANTRVGAPVVPVKPVAAVSITGTLVDKATLTADTSATTGGVVTSWTYRWTRATTLTGSYSNITNATRSTYVLTSSDVGRYLKVRVTATNSGGSSTATSAATGQVLGLASVAPVAQVSISGNTAVSSRLTASTSGTTGSTPLTYTYQWLRATTADGTYTAISRATSSTYRLVSADRGRYIKVRLVATNSAGTSTVTSAATTIIR